jgi:hypothetical protein
MITDYAELLIEAHQKLKDIQDKALDRNYDAASETAMALVGVAALLREQLKKTKF